MEEFALFVSVMTLLAVNDYGIVWRRLTIITIALILLAVMLGIGALLNTYVMPWTSKFDFIPDEVTLPFLGGLLILIGGWKLFDSIKRRRRKEPKFSGDPGDYKLGR